MQQDVLVLLLTTCPSPLAALENSSTKLTYPTAKFQQRHFMLKTGLTVDKQVYRAAKRAVSVTNIVHKAKSNYFSSQIAQSNCCKELFSVCNALRGCNFGLSLPTALPVCDLPDAFAISSGK